MKRLSCVLIALAILTHGPVLFAQGDVAARRNQLSAILQQEWEHTLQVHLDKIELNREFGWGASIPGFGPK